MLDESTCVRWVIRLSWYVWVLKKEFADDIEVLGRPIEDWGNINSYVLLYATCANTYAYVTAYYVCYL